MKLGKFFVSTLAVVMTFAAGLSLAGCKGVSVPDAPIGLPASGASTTVAVHDPSIFYDNTSQKYYAFGTHYAVASSDDLINWVQEVSEPNWTMLYSGESVVINGVSWPKELEETVNLVRPDSSVNTTWAPDVHKIGNKYYMYYSLTGGFGNFHSAIGRV